MTTIYTTKRDYINQQVLPALPPEMHYLAEDVAGRMLTWHSEIDSDGNYRIDKSGLVLKPEVDFWTEVQNAEDAFNSEEARF